MALAGRIYLVTGSTDGLGKATARRLALDGATVLIHGRNEYKGENVLKRMKAETGNPNIELFLADLSSLEQIRQLSRDIHEKYDRIDVLIHNAAVFEEKRRESIDGYEMTFAVNVLAPFLLTYLLLDMLPKNKGDGRIVIVGSMQHSYCIDFTDLQLEKSYDGITAYEMSKLCAIIIAYELAERLQPFNITVNTLDPGMVDTDLLHAGWKFYGMPPEEADSVYLMATQPLFAKVSGGYYVRKRESRSAEVSYKTKTRRRLWALLEEMAGAPYP
ncbi:polyprenol dehydrogenase-like [Ptychodera flava]|uniref:polyprenol dehydrogenase-like n=1 Tax=Ptychodera flava TaxID=63121 RepID=UPI00396A45B7